MKIFVTGATGQLGRAIVKDFSRRYEVIAPTRKQLDLTNPVSVFSTVHDVRPSVIVNCSGYNDVDGAEADSVSALKINALAVRTLAVVANQIGATLVHYSSDFVFDGTATEPYQEENDPHPQSAYAVSKLLGEFLMRDANRHYLLRVESLFGGVNDRWDTDDVPQRRKSSIDQIIESIVAERETRVFVDRVVSPSYIEDVATATRSMVERGVPEGLYHCVNSGMGTWLELAQEVGRQLGRDTELIPISASNADFVATRPKFCALSNAKLESVGIKMPTWQDALNRHLASLKLKA